MLPAVTLSAEIGSGADRAADVLRNPFYNLTAGQHVGVSTPV